MTKKTILLIDDDEDFLRVLAKRCESIGLDVKQTRNLLSATLITAKRYPDIICVDIQMPTGNGLSFCDALAADADAPRVPVVVLTGSTDLKTRRACERLRAYYVEKSPNYWSMLEPILRQLAIEKPEGNLDPGDNTLVHRLPPSSNRSLSKTKVPEHFSPGSIKQILVVGDDADIVKMLSQRCGSLGCLVTSVNNALDAINEIHRLIPDLVFLDVSMSRGNGPSVCEMMVSNQRLQKTPVIVLTSQSDETTIRRCHDLLMYYVEKSVNTWERVEPLLRELLYLDKSSTVSNISEKQLSTAVSMEKALRGERDHGELIDAVFAVLGAANSEKCEDHNGDDSGSILCDNEDFPWILCIDDDVDFSDALKIRLEDHGVAVVRAFSGMEGYRLAFTTPASAILLDVNMPNGQGDYILGRLKDNPVTRDIPVVVITGTNDKVLERRMLAMGATAYFVKPVSFDQVREHLSKYVDILGLTKESRVTGIHRKKSRRIMPLTFEPH